MIIQRIHLLLLISSVSTFSILFFFSSYVDVDYQDYVQDREPYGTLSVLSNVIFDSTVESTDSFVITASDLTSINLSFGDVSSSPTPSSDNNPTTSVAPSSDNNPTTSVQEPAVDGFTTQHQCTSRVQMIRNSLTSRNVTQVKQEYQISVSSDNH